MDDPTPSLRSSLVAPLAPGLREWVLGLTGAMLLVHLIRQVLAEILAGIVGLLGLILLSIMAFNTGSNALRQAATGPGARGVGIFNSEFAEGLAVRLIVLWVLATVLLAAFVQLGQYVGLVIGLAVVVAALPATTIVLVLSNSFFEAFYPPGLVCLATRIGRRDYASLCALLVIGGLGYLAVSVLLSTIGVPEFLRNALLFGIWTWSVLAWFCHAGSVLYVHRDELNLIEPDTGPKPIQERFTRDADALWEEIRARGGTREMHAVLARQLQRSGNRERPLEHGRLHIEALLLAFDAPDEALDRADRLLAADSDFCLERPASMRALIDAAKQQQVSRLAGRLCRNYLLRFPHSGKCNDVRLTGCEALAEDSSALHAQAHKWFQELMTAELDDDQRTRLAALAPRYLREQSF